MKAVIAKYGSKIDYRFRDYPLEQIHPRAKTASIAARCANVQGKFWEYHDKVFEHQGKTDDKDFIGFAKDLNLKVDEFTSCYNDKKFAADVEKDIQAGRSYGLNGTPGYFINGIFINGAVPAEKLMEIIDQEI